MVGALIGGIIGYVKGSVFGMFFGAYIGTMVERWISENVLGRPSRQNRIQQAYFQALFTSIGKLAKVDGVITADEIRKCEIIMQRMRLSSAQKKLAIHYFNQGKEDHFDLAPILNSFHQTSRYSLSVKQMFMEMLLEVAIADNRINQPEWKLLLTIGEYLRFPQQLFVTLVRMRGFNVGAQQGHRGSGSSQNNYQQWTSPKQQKTNSYQILGVNESDSKSVIRRAYKKLMSSHHPDKLIAKGLPPEMIEIAKTKTQNIQAAWEDIKNSRGF